MAGVLSNVSGLSQTLWALQVFRQKPDGRRHPPGYAASLSTRHGLAQKLPSTSIYQKLNSNAPLSKAWSPGYTLWTVGSLAGSASIVEFFFGDLYMTWGPFIQTVQWGSAKVYL